MNCLYPIDHNCCKFFFSQHPFIESAKSVSVLNSMIQEALNIMEEESTREENEVRFVTWLETIRPFYVNNFLHLAKTYWSRIFLMLF